MPVSLRVSFVADCKRAPYDGHCAARGLPMPHRQPPSAASGHASIVQCTPSPSVTITACGLLRAFAAPSPAMSTFSFHAMTPIAPHTQAITRAVQATIAAGRGYDLEAVLREADALLAHESR